LGKGGKSKTIPPGVRKRKVGGKPKKGIAVRPWVREQHGKRRGALTGENLEIRWKSAWEGKRLGKERMG